MGQCLFYACDSRLQLRFSAIAHFTHSSSSGTIGLPTDALKRPDQPSIWITEAPELEIRLSIGVHICLELATSALICSLSEMLRHSKVLHKYSLGKLLLTLIPAQVWSDLGFAIVLKGHGDNQNTDAIRAHCITFGLCRIPTTSKLTKGRALPNVLRNPPDAHVPPGVPSISLSAINIYAEYEYPQGEQSSYKPIHSHVEHMSQLQWLFPSAECYYPRYLENSEVAAYSLSPREPRIYSVKDNTLLPDHEVRPPSSQYDPTDNLFMDMLRLIDLALRKLIISSTARDGQIKIDDDNTLVSLSDLAPAVFNPKYREVSFTIYRMRESEISSPCSGHPSKSSINPDHF